MDQSKMFCTDCNEPHDLSVIRPDGRCPICGGARVVELISHTSNQVGGVKVNMTFGRIGARKR